MLKVWIPGNPALMVSMKFLKISSLLGDFFFVFVISVQCIYHDIYVFDGVLSYQVQGISKTMCVFFVHNAPIF